MCRRGLTNFFQGSMLHRKKNQDSKRIDGLILGLTFKCLNLEYLCSVSPLYKYARLYADYAKILQHSFKSVLLLNQCYMVVTYLKIVLDWGEKNFSCF